MSGSELCQWWVSNPEVGIRLFTELWNRCSEGVSLCCLYFIFSYRKEQNRTTRNEAETFKLESRQRAEWSLPALNESITSVKHDELQWLPMCWLTWPSFLICNIQKSVIMSTTVSVFWHYSLWQLLLFIKRAGIFVEWAELAHQLWLHSGTSPGTKESVNTQANLTLHATHGTCWSQAWNL